jgi:hypothetical protein
LGNEKKGFIILKVPKKTRKKFSRATSFLRPDQQYVHRICGV